MAVHVTPTRRAASAAAAEPAANSPHAAADTGPMSAPASVSPPTSSESRTGMNVSKAIIPTLQKTSTRTSARRTPLRPSSRTPATTTRGASRAESRARRRPRASTCVLGSRRRTSVATRLTTTRTMESQYAFSSAVRARTGCHAMTPPETTAPSAIATPSTVPARARPCSTGTSGSSAWAVSTYQDSSGPESSARKTPWSRSATQKAAKVCARTKTSADTSATTLEATSSGRRPRASANPPVGSSSASTTKPCIERMTPSCASDIPRSRARSVVTPMTSPTGNQRVKVSSRRTRSACRAVSGAVAGAAVLTAGRRPAGRGRGRPGT